MKRIVVIMALLLCLAGVTKAGLWISVDWFIDPPDSTIILRPSDTIELGIWGDGLTDQTKVALGISMASPGPGSLDISNAVLPQGGTVMMMDDVGTAEAMGIQNPFIVLEIGGIETLCHGIKFHCEGPGDTSIIMADWNGMIFDHQIIHQIPEPMTIALLGMGSLLLRRKK